MSLGWVKGHFGFADLITHAAWDWALLNYLMFMMDVQLWSFELCGQASLSSPSSFGTCQFQMQHFLDGTLFGDPVPALKFPCLLKPAANANSAAGNGGNEPGCWAAMPWPEGTDERIYIMYDKCCANMHCHCAKCAFINPSVLGRAHRI